MNKARKLMGIIVFVLSVLFISNTCYTASSNTKLTNQIVKDIKAYIKNHSTISLSTKWLAHRGVPKYAPENTLQSFKIAAKLGARAVETDIRMTSDGYLICHHDAGLSKTTNEPGIIAKLTLEEIEERIVQTGVDYKGQTYENLHIPTFEQYLDLMKNYKKTICRIELKKVPAIQDVNIYAQKIYDAIVAAEMEGQCQVVSASYDTLYAFVKADKKGIKKGNKTIIVKYCGSNLENRQKLRKYAGKKIFPQTNPYTGVLSDAPIVIKKNVRYDLVNTLISNKYKFVLQKK